MTIIIFSQIEGLIKLLKLGHFSQGIAAKCSCSKLKMGNELESQ